MGKMEMWGTIFSHVSLSWLSSAAREMLCIRCCGTCSIWITVLGAEDVSDTFFMGFKELRELVKSYDSNLLIFSFFSEH